MYANVFARYVPVIKILMKKCRQGETQQLNLNISDFEKAGLARKSGVKFDLKLLKGKPEKVVVSAPAAAGFLEALMADETTAQMLKAEDFQFALSNKYSLTISCSSKTAPVPEAEASQPVAQ